MLRPRTEPHRSPGRAPIRIGRLLAVSATTGLLCGSLFGYPQFVDAGWSHEAAVWLCLIGIVGPAMIVAGLAMASRAVSELLGLRPAVRSAATLAAPPPHSTPGRHSRAA